MEWQEKWEVVVVGSGAGGLVAAITAVNNGQKVLLVEKCLGIFRHIMLRARFLRNRKSDTLNCSYK